MDRTSWIALIVCFALLFFYQPILYYFFPEWKQPAPSPETESIQPAKPVESATSDLLTPAPANEDTTPVMGQDTTAVPAPPIGLSEEVLVLSNDYFDVAFTNWGGAIKTVTLKEHERENGLPIVLNDGSPLPVFSITGWQGLPGSFTATEVTQSTITYELELQPGVKLERVYTISEGYQIECVQTVYVPEGQPMVLPPYHMALGTITPIYGTSEERRFTGMAWHTPNPGGSYDDS